MTSQRSPFDFLESLTALESAKTGDFRPLSEKVRSGENLTEEDRGFIADYLIGEVKLDGRAAQRQRTTEEHLAIAMFVLQLEATKGWRRKAAVDLAHQLIGFSKRTIQSAMKTHRDQPGRRFREILAGELAKRRQIAKLAD